MDGNNDSIGYSTGGFDFLEQYLCILYGEERGKYVNNLQRYFNSDEFKNQCSQASSLYDIPIISEDNIRAQINRDTRFFEKAEYIVNFFDEHTIDKSITIDDYIAIAGELGLCGGTVEWYNTMFPHTVNLFVNSLDEQNSLNDSVHSNTKLIKLIVRIMLDGMRDGQVLEIEGRRYWSQGYIRQYFRGENAYYVTSRPSLCRGLKVDAAHDPNSDMYDDNVAETIRIGLLKTVEFSLWVHNLNFVNKWPFPICEGAICQHYGLHTPYLDVTSDLKVALFFACCTFENDNWRPLRDNEFAEKNSRKDVADLGGDSRYGVIFTAPADIVSMIQASNKIPYSNVNIIRPIGYQPFMRSVNQKGYIIDADLHYDMYKDCRFSKFRFRLTREICDWIFNEMKSGDLIYGNDPIMDISDIVDEIENSHYFSCDALNIYLKMNPQLEREYVMNYLNFHGYEIKDDISLCSPERQREIEEHWWEYIPDKYFDMKIVQRPIITLF